MDDEDSKFIDVAPLLYNVAPKSDSADSKSGDVAPIFSDEDSLLCDVEPLLFDVDSLMVDVAPKLNDVDSKLGNVGFIFWILLYTAALIYGFPFPGQVAIGNLGG